MNPTLRGSYACKYNWNSRLNRRNAMQMYCAPIHPSGNAIARTETPPRTPMTVAIIGLVMAGGLAACSSKPHEFDKVDAIMMCRDAITAQARDPDKVDIPTVDDFGNSHEYYFAWGASSKRIRMRNGLGMEVPVTASCIVNRKSKRITSLTINGETLI